VLPVPRTDLKKEQTLSAALLALGATPITHKQAQSGTRPVLCGGGAVVGTASKDAWR
jgi:hypothetical protein